MNLNELFGSRGSPSSFSSWALKWLSLGILILLLGCRRDTKTTFTGARAEIEPAGQPSSDSDSSPLVLPINDRSIPRRPQESDWSSEVFHERTQPILRTMQEYFVTRACDDASFVAPDFSATVYDSRDCEVVYAKAPFHVSRLRPDAKPRAVDSLEEFLSRFSVASQVAKEQTAELKTVRVERQGDLYRTQLLVHVFAQLQRRRTQHNATWVCDWDVSQAGRVMLNRVRVARNSVEKIELNSADPILADKTDAVLSGLDCYRKQLTHGSSFWLRRIDARLGLDIVALHGLAVADINNDGRDDIYLCTQAGLPNRLLVQAADGSLQDWSRDLGLDFCDFSRHALIVDFDNDGDQDLVVHLNASIVFLRNRGAGGFEPAHEHRMPGMPYSLCAADFDQDGQVDVYVTCREPFVSDNNDANVLGNPIPYHDANNGSPNVLLRNLGDLRFVDVTREVGLDANNRRFSYAASWEDYDRDGDQDLYVANDFGRNNLYRNDNGRFVDVAGEAGVEDISAGMSVSWGDANLDGRMDIYVGNMFSSAGNRIAYQQQFQSGLNQQARQQFQRHARGNTLFLNQGGSRFEDATLGANAYMGRWSWSSNFVDVNNDGWQDLVVANGFVTSDSTDDL